MAKNYLIEQECKGLNRVVEQNLLYAEDQAARQIPRKMADWIQRLDSLLKFNERDVLTNPGKVSMEVAQQLAAEQYDQFRVKQDQAFESDFEREVKRIQGSKDAL